MVIILKIIRCFEQNNCGGLFTAHEEGTSRSDLGACAYFEDVSKSYFHLGYFRDIFLSRIFFTVSILKVIKSKRN